MWQVAIGFVGPEEAKLCIKEYSPGASPVAEGVSWCALLRGPGFCQFGFRVQTWHRSSSHVEVASHIAQLEGTTTRTYNYVLGGFGEKKRKQKESMCKMLEIQENYQTSCSVVGYRSVAGSGGR